MSVAQIDADALQAEAAVTTKPEHIFVTYWKRLRRHRLAMVSLALLGFLIASVIVGPMIMSRMTYYNFQQGRYVPYARDTQDLLNVSAGRSWAHPLGTDSLGRDTLYRLLVAGRLSLFISFTVVMIRETIGIFLGSVSGYFGGWVDNLLQRLTEFILILPALPLLLTLSSLFRNVRIPGVAPEWSQAIVIIAILSLLGWTGGCRLSRAMVLSLRNQEFTEASRALGLSSWAIIRRHMVPNAIPPIIVNATLGLGGVILTESALSFLGFGINPPVATWGNMLQEAQSKMLQDPTLALYPGMFIFVTVLAFNYLGDGLRDALDPRLKL